MYPYKYQFLYNITFVNRPTQKFTHFIIFAIIVLKHYHLGLMGDEDINALNKLYHLCFLKP